MLADTLRKALTIRTTHKKYESLYLRRPAVMLLFKDVIVMLSVTMSNFGQEISFRYDMFFLAKSKCDALRLDNILDAINSLTLKL